MTKPKWQPSCFFGVQPGPLAPHQETIETEAQLNGRTSSHYQKHKYIIIISCTGAIWGMVLVRDCCEKACNQPPGDCTMPAGVWVVTFLSRFIYSHPLMPNLSWHFVYKPAYNPRYRARIALGILVLFRAIMYCDLFFSDLFTALTITTNFQKVANYVTAISTTIAYTWTTTTIVQTRQYGTFIETTLLLKVANFRFLLETYGCNGATWPNI